MSYNYTQTLEPYGSAPEAGRVHIDPAARYGYWEHANGVEGGGLWFAPSETSSALELIDFDGWYMLPRKVVAALRAAGYELDETFDD